jgi:hypothetical protein
MSPRHRQPPKHRVKNTLKKLDERSAFYAEWKEDINKSMTRFSSKLEFYSLELERFVYFAIEDGDKLFNLPESEMRYNESQLAQIINKGHIMDYAYGNKYVLNGGATYNNLIRTKLKQINSELETMIEEGCEELKVKYSRIREAYQKRYDSDKVIYEKQSLTSEDSRRQLLEGLEQKFKEDYQTAEESERIDLKKLEYLAYNSWCTLGEILKNRIDPEEEADKKAPKSQNDDTDDY